MLLNFIKSPAAIIPEKCPKKITLGIITCETKSIENLILSWY